MLQRTAETEFRHFLGLHGLLGVEPRLLHAWLPGLNGAIVEKTRQELLCSLARQAGLRRDGGNTTAMASLPSCMLSQAVGNIMLSLHRNLQEIQTSLDGGSSFSNGNKFGW